MVANIVQLDATFLAGPALSHPSVASKREFSLTPSPLSALTIKLLVKQTPALSMANGSAVGWKS